MALSYVKQALDYRLS